MSEPQPGRFAFLRRKVPDKGDERTGETSVIAPSVTNGLPATKVASAGAESLIETALGESGRRGFFGRVLSAMAAMRSPLTGGVGTIPEKSGLQSLIGHGIDAPWKRDEALPSLPVISGFGDMLKNLVRAGDSIDSMLHFADSVLTGENAPAGYGPIDSQGWFGSVIY